MLFGGTKNPLQAAQCIHIAFEAKVGKNNQTNGTEKDKPSQPRIREIVGD